MLTREQKQDQIQELQSTLGPVQGLFVMSFTGLTVSEVTELRQKVKEARGAYVVVKNTLARIAVSESHNESVKGLLQGPTALAYTTVDPVLLAKALADFAKGHDKLQFRGGVVEGQALDARAAQQVATMPSKPELVSRLLYLLQSPVRRLAVAVNWPLRSLAVTVNQIAENKGPQA